MIWIPKGTLIEAESGREAHSVTGDFRGSEEASQIILGGLIMKTLIEICEAIQKLESKADLKVVYAAANQRSRELYNFEVAHVKKDFSLQQEVTFIHKGRVIHGKIIKKNEKRAVVSVVAVDGQGFAQDWHVPYTKLSAV